MAINTAITIQMELKRRFSCETVIGITKGKCYFGFFGWLAERVEYSIMGPTVNLSARLMTAGKSGDILVDTFIHEEALSSKSNLYKFEKNGALTLKGFSRPVENYKVIVSEELGKDTKKERLSVAIQVLSSGLSFSEETIVKMGEFLFNPINEVRIESGDIACYFVSLMQSINTRLSFYYNRIIIIIVIITIIIVLASNPNIVSLKTALEKASVKDLKVL